MRKITYPLFVAASLLLFSCANDQEFDQSSTVSEADASGRFAEVNFHPVATIQVGGEASSEISAFDSKSNRLFTVNPANDQISVFDFSDVKNPVSMGAIAIVDGSPNSVAVHHGMVAVAIEADPKQNPGKINIYDAGNLNLINSYSVGALPDMVAFSPNGKYVVSANEGEPNDDYSVDPDGTISIIEIQNNTITTLDFSGFNSIASELARGGYRVFGPGANLAADTEPEYIAISDNSNYAWVSLQENNGLAKVNLETKAIEDIFPLGFKDYSLAENSLDASNRDDEKTLKTWPVYGMYQPDAIKYIKIQGMDYIISANEGDARDYDGYSEEARIKDIELDPVAFPNVEFLQENENLGRLNITNSLGDTDGDGDFDELYSYGARSFSIWSGNGQLLYDSGNDIAEITLALTPETFNDDDSRSDDKGAEPESVETLQINGNRQLLFVGLERTDQVLVFEISNPMAPKFLQILSNEGDEAPEGVLAIAGKDSPNKKDLLIVSNEDSGTVTIYQNN